MIEIPTFRLEPDERHLLLEHDCNGITVRMMIPLFAGRHYLQRKTPLTLFGEISCSTCKMCGHVEDGRWERC